MFDSIIYSTIFFEYVSYLIHYNLFIYMLQLMQQPLDLHIVDIKADIARIMEPLDKDEKTYKDFICICVCGCARARAHQENRFLEVARYPSHI